MSLVIDALRRAGASSPGAESTSIRLSAPRPRRRLWPVMAAAVAGVALGLSMRPVPAAAPLRAETPATPDSPWGPGRTVLAATERAAAAPLVSSPTPRPAIRRIPSPSPAAAETVPLVLRGISSRDGLPIAMINERLVREGETIDGFRVTKIGAETVEGVRPDGTVVVLSFPEMTPLPEASPTWDPRRQIEP